MTPGPNQVIGGKYRLLRLLGEGGMGAVYEAEHTLLGTHVAVKVLHSEHLERTGLIDRFLQEARVVAQITSPHIVQVIDVDRTPEGDVFIVMELLKGESLSKLLERERRLSLQVACDYTIQILTALEAAHALGVVHRDLKPDNVIITFAGAKPVIKLIDFGIAKLRRGEASIPMNAGGSQPVTLAGTLMGTAEYMAPEQAFSAETADARSDVYAVGVMLFEMIAGVRPVDGEDGRIVAMKVERGEVRPLVHVVPEVPREIAGLVHRAMASRPALRFENAMSMRLALTAALKGQPAQRAQAQTAFGTPLAVTSPARPVAASSPRTELGGATPPIVPQVISPSRTPRKKKGGGALWVLVTVIPLLIGAGLVSLFVWGQERTTIPLEPALTALPIPPSVHTAESSQLVQDMAPDANANLPKLETPSITPLTPDPRGAKTPTRPPPAVPSSQPSANRDADKDSSARPSEVPTPFSIPSSLPTAFPSSFPNPFPISIPSSIPIPIPVPSGFPSSIPIPFPFPFPGMTPPPADSSSPPQSP